MKQKKYSGGGGSSGGDSSEDDMIIHPEEYQEGGNEEIEEWNEEDDIFENSQDLTQIVPRSKAKSESPKKKKKKKEKRKETSVEERGEEEDEDIFEGSQDVTQIVPRQSVIIKKEPESPKKKQKEKQKGFVSPPVASPSKVRNGYRVREVDVSEIPEHVISNLKRVLPKDSDCTEGLSSEDIEKAASSSKGGAWIFQCPKSTNISDLLTGKKFPLDWLGGGRFLFEKEGEDTQADTLCINRQFEAVSVTEEGYTEGMMLLLPDSNSFKMIAAPVNGHIIIREAVQELTIPKVKVKKSKPRKLPSGIKERHPVYGADFTSIIQEMEAAPKALSSRKKKKSQSQSEMPPSWEPIKQNGFCKSDYEPYAIINQDTLLDQEQIISSKKKKKKKKKHSETEEPTLDKRINGNTFEDGDETGKPEIISKKRKRKRENDSLDLDETQILLASNDNDVIVKKRKKSKHRE